MTVKPEISITRAQIHTLQRALARIVTAQRAGLALAENIEQRLVPRTKYANAARRIGGEAASARDLLNSVLEPLQDAATHSDR